MEHRLAAILSADAAGYTPDFFGAHMQLTSIYAQLGEMKQPRAALAELLRLRPGFSIARIPRVGFRDVLVENLRKAGLRE